MGMTDRPVCAGCKKALLPGEPRWTARRPAEEWHWACAEHAGIVFAENTKAVDKAMSRFPKS